MSLKFIGNNGLKTLMSKIITSDAFPNESINTNELNELWNTCDMVIGEESDLANYTYTLNEDNKRINITKFTNYDAESVVLYSGYKINDKVYRTKLTDASFLFGGNDRLWWVDKDNYPRTNLFENLVSVDIKPGIDCSELTNMDFMFSQDPKLTTITGLEYLDTSNVTSMRCLFYLDRELNPINISSWNTSKVTNMEYMFSYCEKFTSLDLSNFNTTNVTKMNSMFDGLGELVNLNISSFDTSKVTTMFAMFYACNKLTTLDLSKFDTSNVTDIGKMFIECYGLTSLDLTTFDTSKVTTMLMMFQKATNLTSIKVSKNKWIISDDCEVTDMFDQCGVSEVTYVD